MTTPNPDRSRSRRSVLGLLGAAPLTLAAGTAFTGTAHARPAPAGARVTTGGSGGRADLEARLREILDRTGLDGTWGLKFAYLDTGEPICALNSAQPYNPGSSFKLFVAGTAFEELGTRHRVRTRVYATGPIRHGVLHGDLVLVAGGDLFLGGRIQPDGSLALPEPDHTYARGNDPTYEPLPGDPLRSLRLLADQIAAHGVRRVTGNVVVDTSLFPQKAVEGGGQPIAVSPMMVNDNVLDLTLTPGRRPGDPARITLSPQVGYVRIVNKIQTIDEADPDNVVPLRISDDVEHPDGTRTATLEGTMPVGPSCLFAYHVPDPGRFAEFALAQVLRDRGVHARPTPRPQDRSAPTSHERGTLVAELVSLPLSDMVKPMLKVSSNPHTANFPHLIGAVAAGEHENPEQAYEKLRSDLFREAGLDPYPPGSEEGAYSADFFVTFLDHMNDKPYLTPYIAALPVTAKDGEGGYEDDGSPAVGNVFAKGGTSMAVYGDEGSCNKALAGFMRIPGPTGERTAGFAVLSGFSMAPSEIDRVVETASATIWTVVSTVYETLA